MKLHVYLHQFLPKFIYLNSLNEKIEILKELKSISGIYLWYNNKTQHFYIGSAKDLSNRLARYYRVHELNRVSSSLIHKALLTHGHKEFTLYILETCSPEDLILREQYYFNLLTPIYNILKFASSSKGYTHTEQVRKIMSETKMKDPKLISRIITLAKLNTGKKHSEEFKKLRSELIKGPNNPNYGKGNPILELDILNNISTTYSSVTNTATAHNTTRSVIRYCIKNQTIYKSRYCFKYTNLNSLL